MSSEVVKANSDLATTDVVMTANLDVGDYVATFAIVDLDGPTILIDVGWVYSLANCLDTALNEFSTLNLTRNDLKPYEHRQENWRDTYNYNYTKTIGTVPITFPGYSIRPREKV